MDLRYHSEQNMFSTNTPLKTSLKHVSTNRLEIPSYTIALQSNNHYHVELKNAEGQIVGEMEFYIVKDPQIGTGLFIATIDNLSGTSDELEVEYNYKYVGQALLEIAFRCSLDPEKGSEGLVVLGAIANSHYFYHKYGFRFADKNEDVNPYFFYISLATALYNSVNGKVVHGLPDVFLTLSSKSIIAKCQAHGLAIPDNLTEKTNSANILAFADLIMSAAEHKDLSLDAYLTWRLDYFQMMSNRDPKAFSEFAPLDNYLAEQLIPHLINNPAEMRIIIAGLLALTHELENKANSIQNILSNENIHAHVYRLGQGVLARDIRIPRAFVAQWSSLIEKPELYALFQALEPGFIEKNKCGRLVHSLFRAQQARKLFEAETVRRENRI